MTDRDVPTEDLDAAFELLADETRLGILGTLWECAGRSLPFSSLRKRAGVADSGRFNYHLDKLVPQFVREIDGEYELTHAGRRVVGAAVSGSFTDAETTSTDPVTVGDCGNCGGPVEAVYERGRLRVQCVECDAEEDRLAVSPVVASGHDTEDLPEVFGRRVLTDVQALNRGFCPLCDGHTESVLTRDSPHEPVLPEDRVEVTYLCRECGYRRQSSVVAPLLDHPAVLGFLYEGGVDLRETPVYDVEGLDDFDATVTSEDPVRVTVPIEHAGRALRVTLDGSLDVIDVERG